MRQGMTLIDHQRTEHDDGARAHAITRVIRGRRTAGRPAGQSARGRTGPLVTRFVVAGVVALIALAVASVFASRRAGTDESIRDAIDRTSLLAATVFEPNLTPELLAGDPAARDRMSEVARALDASMFVHYRLWTLDGTVVHADEPEIIGMDLPLSDDATDAFRAGVPSAEISDLSADENFLEREQGNLLEVYFPVRALDGTPLLLETYQPMALVEDSAHSIWWQFLPAVLVPLVLLQLVQIPLAVRLARQARADRVQMLRSAEEASVRERQAIAHDLHDGAVQDLAGVSFSLSALAARVPPDARAEVDQLVASINGSVESLRTLFTEIYPPDLGAASLAESMEEIADRLRAHGVTVHVDCPPVLTADLDQLKVVFRVAQEATRNVARHADAGHVWIAVDEHRGMLSVSVRDDGRGFDIGPSGPPRRAGHLGMRMMCDVVESAGGAVTVTSTPGHGTVVAALIPA